MIPHGDVVVRDGAIQQVGAGLPVPAGAEVIEGEGKTLLPGLIDAHIHAGDELKALRQALTFGVTLALDLFVPHALLGQLRQRKAASGGARDAVRHPHPHPPRPRLSSMRAWPRART